jgi:hypothetical protein
LTPAPPPKATRKKQQSQKPQTPARQPHGSHPARPASIYASRQIQKSQNRRAVALLFSPHLNSGRQPGPSRTLGAQQQRHQPASPSPLVRNPNTLTPLHRYDVFSPGEANPGLDSDAEELEDIQSGIKSLNLVSGK